MTTNNLIEKLKNDWLEYLELERGKASLTVSNYGRYLTKFIEFTNVSTPQDITVDVVKKFRLLLNRKKIGHKPISVNTQAYYLIVLRNFLDYLVRIKNLNVLSPKHIEIPKIKRNLPNFLTEGELKEIFDHLNKAKKNLKNLRDRAIIEMLFSTGLRVSELTSINRDSLDLTRNELSIIGKGSKPRIVFLSERSQNALKEYLIARKDFDNALFVRLKNTKHLNSLRLSVRQIQRIVVFWAKKAGIVKKITPHTLRHTFCTDLLMRGADIREIQALAGHSSILTTQIYTHLTDPHLKKVHEKYHGGGKIGQ